MPRAKSSRMTKKKADRAELKFLLPFEQPAVRKFAIRALKRGANPKVAIAQGRRFMARDKLDESGNIKK